MQYLTSLEELKIRDCNEFGSLNNVDADGIEWRHLNSLKVLIIRSLPNLTTFPEISNLTSLLVLQIADCPKLSSLPDGISCLRSLRWLNIKDLPNLMTFLEGITNLTSLQKLEIGTCPNLTSLPDPCLKSLKSLRFYKCPLLEEKYKRGIGEDWHKFTHIPDFNPGFFY